MKKVLPLSPLDHVFTGVGSYPIEFVFAYDGTIDPERLRRSLHATLERFGPLRSVLVRGAPGAYGLRISDDGLVFEVDESPRRFEASADAYRFLSPVETAEGQPLTRIRLTQTPPGSVLGVSISHALADGFSYFLFLSSWSRVLRGGEPPEPFHKRRLLIPGPEQERRRVTADDVLADCGAFWDERRSPVARERLRWERLTMPSAQLNELLAAARSESDGRLSYNDVVTAFLWRKYLTQWTAGGGLTYLSVPVDFRRLVSSFPRDYFGCAVYLATTALERDALVQAKLGELAARVRASVARVDESVVRRALETLEALRRQEGLSIAERLHVMHPRRGLLVTNLSRLPVHELDFGAGPPAAFEILTPAQRGAVVLPAADGVEVRVCLPQAGANTSKAVRS